MPDPSPDSLTRLDPAQQQALRNMRAGGLGHSAAARQALEKHLLVAGLAPASLDQLLVGLWRQARIMVHFHPDRLDARGRSVATGLLEDGHFKTQFETGLSAGSPTAFVGGERDQWEQSLFGGAYHTPAGAGVERPKYGALDLLGHPDGPAPRFGSCYLVLKPEVCARSSYTYAGSQAAQALRCSGTHDAFLPVLAAVWAALAEGTGGLGDVQLDVQGFCERLHPSPAERPWAERPLGRALDSFIEAQIHGPLDLRRDADKLVADPCFRGGPLENRLQALCRRYELALAWHPGFCLPLADVPETFRGYAVRPLAARAAEQGKLHAAGIGGPRKPLEDPAGKLARLGQPGRDLDVLSASLACVGAVGRRSTRL